MIVIMKNLRLPLLLVLGSTIATAPAHAIWPFKPKQTAQEVTPAAAAPSPAAASRSAATATTHSPVLRLAPDFAFQGAGKKTLRGLKGQPVVLIIAESPETKLFRKQLKQLDRGYSRFASRQAVFAVAFRNGNGPVQSNVPFVVVNNGPAVASAYGVDGVFALAIIGTDLNVDYQTNMPVPPERIMDVIQNAYPVQLGARKDKER
jgi:hypothetical protein